MSSEKHLQNLAAIIAGDASNATKLEAASNIRDGLRIALDHEWKVMLAQGDAEIGVSSNVLALLEAVVCLVMEKSQSPDPGSRSAAASVCGYFAAECTSQNTASRKASRSSGLGLQSSHVALRLEAFDIDRVLSRGTPLLARDGIREEALLAAAAYEKLPPRQLALLRRSEIIRLLGQESGDSSAGPSAQLDGSDGTEVEAPSGDASASSAQVGRRSAVADESSVIKRAVTLVALEDDELGPSDLAATGVAPRPAESVSAAGVEEGSTGHSLPRMAAAVAVDAAGTACSPVGQTAESGLATAAQTSQHPLPLPALLTQMHSELWNSLQHNLFHPVWYARHGAALCLAAILRFAAPPSGPTPTPTAQDGSSASTTTSMAPHGIKLAFEAPTDSGLTPDGVVVDLALRCVALLSLDRFADYAGTRLVAPVQNAAGVLLGLAAQRLPQATVSRLLMILVQLSGRSKWHLRHGMFVGLRSVVAAAAPSLLREAAAPEVRAALAAVYAASARALVHDTAEDVTMMAADTLRALAELRVSVGESTDEATNSSAGSTGSSIFSILAACSEKRRSAATETSASAGGVGASAADTTFWLTAASHRTALLALLLDRVEGIAGAASNAGAAMRTPVGDASTVLAAPCLSLAGSLLRQLGLDVSLAAAGDPAAAYDSTAFLQPVRSLPMIARLATFCCRCLCHPIHAVQRNALSTLALALELTLRISRLRYDGRAGTSAAAASSATSASDSEAFLWWAALGVPLALRSLFRCVMLMREEALHVPPAIPLRSDGSNPEEGSDNVPPRARAQSACSASAAAGIGSHAAKRARKGDGKAAPSASERSDGLGAFTQQLPWTVSLPEPSLASIAAATFDPFGALLALQRSVMQSAVSNDGGPSLSPAAGGADAGALLEAAPPAARQHFTQLARAWHCLALLGHILACSLNCSAPSPPASAAATTANRVHASYEQIAAQFARQPECLANWSFLGDAAALLQVPHGDACAGSATMLPVCSTSLLRRTAFAGADAASTNDYVCFLLHESGLCAANAASCSFCSAAGPKPDASDLPTVVATDVEPAISTGSTGGVVACGVTESSCSSLQSTLGTTSQDVADAAAATTALQQGVTAPATLKGKGKAKAKPRAKAKLPADQLIDIDALSVGSDEFQDGMAAGSGVLDGQDGVVCPWDAGEALQEPSAASEASHPAASAAATAAASAVSTAATGASGLGSMGSGISADEGLAAADAALAAATEEAASPPPMTFLKRWVGATTLAMLVAALDRPIAAAAASAAAGESALEALAPLPLLFAERLASSAAAALPLSLSMDASQAAVPVDLNAAAFEGVMLAVEACASAAATAMHASGSPARREPYDSAVQMLDLSLSALTDRLISAAREPAEACAEALSAPVNDASTGSRAGGVHEQIGGGLNQLLPYRLPSECAWLTTRLLSDLQDAYAAARAAAAAAAAQASACVAIAQSFSPSMSATRGRRSQAARTAEMATDPASAGTDLLQAWLQRWSTAPPPEERASAAADAGAAPFSAAETCAAPHSRMPEDESAEPEPEPVVKRTRGAARARAAAATEDASAAAVPSLGVDYGAGVSILAAAPGSPLAMSPALVAAAVELLRGWSTGCVQDGEACDDDSAIMEDASASPIDMAISTARALASARVVDVGRTNAAAGGRRAVPSHATTTDDTARAQLHALADEAAIRRDRLADSLSQLVMRWGSVASRLPAIAASSFVLTRAATDLPLPARLTPLVRALSGGIAGDASSETWQQLYAAQGMTAVLHFLATRTHAVASSSATTSTSPAPAASASAAAVRAAGGAALVGGMHDSVSDATSAPSAPLSPLLRKLLTHVVELAAESEDGAAAGAFPATLKAFAGGAASEEASAAARGLLLVLRAGCNGARTPGHAAVSSVLAEAAFAAFPGGSAVSVSGSSRVVETAGLAPAFVAAAALAHQDQSPLLLQRARGSFGGSMLEAASLALLESNLPSSVVSAAHAAVRSASTHAFPLFVRHVCFRVLLPVLRASLHAPAACDAQLRMRSLRALALLREVLSTPDVLVRTTDTIPDLSLQVRSGADAGAEIGAGTGTGAGAGAGASAALPTAAAPAPSAARWQRLRSAALPLASMLLPVLLPLLGAAGLDTTVRNEASALFRCIVHSLPLSMTLAAAIPLLDSGHSTSTDASSWETGINKGVAVPETAAARAAASHAAGSRPRDDRGDDAEARAMCDAEARGRSIIRRLVEGAAAGLRRLPQSVAERVQASETEYQPQPDDGSDAPASIGISSAAAAMPIAAPAASVAVTRLDPAAVIPPHVAPTAHLRGYQLEGIAWLSFLRETGLHGILADDMGLGKTLVTLSAIAAGLVHDAAAPAGAVSGRKPSASPGAAVPLPPNASLVLCPSSLLFHWAAEIERYFAAARVPCQAATAAATATTAAASDKHEPGMSGAAGEAAGGGASAVSEATRPLFASAVISGAAVSRRAQWSSLRRRLIDRSAHSVEAGSRDRSDAAVHTIIVTSYSTLRSDLRFLLGSSDCTLGSAARFEPAADDAASVPAADSRRFKKARVGLSSASTAAEVSEAAASGDVPLSPLPLYYCILDEGHVIRNPTAQLSRAVVSLAPLARHRLVLSGTPLQNSVGDLFALFSFLLPGYLGTANAFRARYLRPLLAARSPQATAAVHAAAHAALTALHRSTLPFILRRLKVDVLTDLPPKTVQDVLVDLPPAQAALYNLIARSRAAGALLEAVKFGSETAAAVSAGSASRADRGGLDTLGAADAAVKPAEDAGDDRDDHADDKDNDDDTDRKAVSSTGSAGAGTPRSGAGLLSAVPRASLAVLTLLRQACNDVRLVSSDALVRHGIAAPATTGTSGVRAISSAAAAASAAGRSEPTRSSAGSAAVGSKRPRAQVQSSSRAAAGGKLSSINTAVRGVHGSLQEDLRCSGKMAALLQLLADLGIANGPAVSATRRISSADDASSDSNSASDSDDGELDEELPGGDESDAEADITGSNTQGAGRGPQSEWDASPAALAGLPLESSAAEATARHKAIIFTQTVATLHVLSSFLGRILTRSASDRATTGGVPAASTGKGAGAGAGAGALTAAAAAASTSDALVLLHGGLSPQERAAVVQRFDRDTDVRVLLSTTAVGGLGLNLTAADTVIFFDSDWNPWVDMQAADRAHRLGQRRAVSVYRLLARHTIEEHVLSLSRWKVHVSSSVINTDNAAQMSSEAVSGGSSAASALSSAAGSTGRVGDASAAGAPVAAPSERPVANLLQLLSEALEPATGPASASLPTGAGKRRGIGADGLHGHGGNAGDDGDDAADAAEDDGEHDAEDDDSAMMAPFAVFKENMYAAAPRGR